MSPYSATGLLGLVSLAIYGAVRLSWWAGTRFWNGR